MSSSESIHVIPPGGSAGNVGGQAEKGKNFLQKGLGKLANLPASIKNGFKAHKEAIQKSAVDNPNTSFLKGIGQIVGGGAVAVLGVGIMGGGIAAEAGFSGFGGGFS